MSDEEFVLILNKAITGDIKSLFEIIDQYRNNIYKASMINGVIDYDCVSYIEDKLLEEIKKFKNFI